MSPVLQLVTKIRSETAMAKKLLFLSVLMIFWFGRTDGCKCRIPRLYCSNSVGKFMAWRKHSLVGFSEQVAKQTTNLNWNFLLTAFVGRISTIFQTGGSRMMYLVRVLEEFKVRTFVCLVPKQHTICHTPTNEQQILFQNTFTQVKFECYLTSEVVRSIGSWHFFHLHTAQNFVCLSAAPACPGIHFCCTFFQTLPGNIKLKSGDKAFARVWTEKDNSCGVPNLSRGNTYAFLGNSNPSDCTGEVQKTQNRPDLKEKIFKWGHILAVACHWSVEMSLKCHCPLVARLTKRGLSLHACSSLVDEWKTLDARTKENYRSGEERSCTCTQCAACSKYECVCSVWPQSGWTHWNAFHE